MSQSVISEVIKALHAQQGNIEDAYHQREVQVERSRSWQTLANQGLVSGTYEQGFRLSSALRDMFDVAVQKEQRRIRAVDIAAWQEQMLHAVEQYTHAKNEQRNDDADHHLEAIRNDVYSLTDSVKDNTALLDLKLDNHFGYVSTLEEKKRENQQVIQQVTRLSDSLALLDRDELDRLASQHIPLRRVFYNDLLTQAQRTREKLQHLLPKLRHKLFGYHRPEHHAQRLKQWRTYLYRHAEFEFSCETEPEKALYNRLPRKTGAIQPRIHLGIAKVNQQVAERLANKVFTERSQTTDPKVKSEKCQLTLSQQSERELNPSQFQTLVVSFIRSLPPNKPVSALLFLQQADQALPSNLWLFALHVWVRQDLDKSPLKQRISAEPILSAQPSGVGNMIIHDYKFTRYA